LGQRFPVANSFFVQIQREEKALYYDDVQVLPHFSGWGGTSTTRGWMGVPLIHRGEVLGYITLDSLEVGSFGAREAAAAQAFANQVAITLVNAQLLLDSQRAAFEQQEVSHILRGLNGSATLADIRSAATIGLHRLIGPGAVEIALYPADEQLIVSERSFWVEGGGEYRRDARSYAVEDSAAVAALRAGKSHFSRDLAEDQQWLIEKEWFLQGYSSAMALPLQGNDRVLGHIRLFWREGLEPNQAIHFSLPQIAEGVALAIQKLALLEQTTRRANELQSLTELSSKLRQVYNREQVTQIVLTHSLALFQADRGYVLTPIPEEDALQVFANVGKGPVAPNTHYGYTDSIAGGVFLTGTPYCSANLFSDPAGHRPTLQAWAKSGLDFVSALYAPLRAGDAIVGVISMTNSETRRSFSQTDLRLFNALAEIAGGALHRSAILERLEQRVEERTADLAAANLRLQELDLMKSDFVTNVSHELRTPLTNITLYLDLVNRGKPEHREHYMQVLQSETAQLRHLVESILDLSTLDRKKESSSGELLPVHLGDVLGSVIVHFQAKAKEAGIHLSTRILGKTASVLGDQERLNQLLVHLMNNAISYTPAGGRVEVGLLNSSKEAGLYVQDTGIGIDEDEIEQIFERFYRGKEVRQSDILGAGLGLSIVSEFVQAHAGRIGVESVRGEG
ncbi:MAG: GAF domain-containing sensor histidine kinase, partial [Caldilineaceae bacterium]|nr:GAF domain-containing sensor histidine kinase [Caldilineaceae bacterium]